MGTIWLNWGLTPDDAAETWCCSADLSHFEVMNQFILWNLHIRDITPPSAWEKHPGMFYKTPFSFRSFFVPLLSHACSWRSLRYCWQTPTPPGVWQTSEEETTGTTSLAGSLLCEIERVTPLKCCTNTFVRKSLGFSFTCFVFEKMLQILKASDADQRAAAHTFHLPEPARVHSRTLNCHKAALWRWNRALQCAEVAPCAAGEPADGQPQTSF